jgi:predicted ATPase
MARSAMRRAEQSGHAPTLAFAHCYTCVFESVRGNPRGAAPHAEALVGFGKEHGMEWWGVMGIFYRGWTRWHAGHRRAGLADMHQAMALCRSYGLSAAPLSFQLLVAEAEAQEGRTDEALAIVDDLLAAMELSGEHQLEAQTRRLRANLLRRHPGHAQAEAAFLAALETARSQKTCMLELRAAVDLAGLYRELNQQARAHDVLEAALRALPEGGALPDVEQARQLLVSLQSEKAAPRMR